jgi:MFS transporter, ACS family, glucarate transporter
MTDPSRPTRVRYAILGLLCVLAMITYMDRAANGSAKKAIMADLNQNQLSTGQTPYQEEDFFIVLMAFQIAYAIFEVPSGWLGDTRGPRSTLLRVVLWWSLFVGLTGFTGWTLPGGLYVGFTALVVIQFLFGVGEAGAFPNISKSLYNWFPSTSRAFAKSTIWMSARLMGGLTPLIWILLVELGGLTWNEALWFFAAVAAVWCLVFFFAFTNKPSEHRKVNDAEVAIIDANRVAPTGHTSVPWGKLIRSRNLWAVCFMYVVTNFCWYFLMYNLPGRLKDTYKDWNATSDGKILLALLSGAPLLVGMAGCLVGGLLSDRYIRRTGDRKWGRRLYGMIGYAGAGTCYLVAAAVSWYWPNNLWPFAIMLMMMGFFNDLIMGPAWATCQDIGQRYAATVSGTMNMFGNLVGAVSGIFFTGLVMTSNLEQPQKILACFATYAAVYFLGVGLWLLIDASKPIVTDERESGLH